MRTTDLAKMLAGPYESRQFRREWEALLKRLGVEYKSPYAMRHGMATRMISERYSIKAVSRRLGHKDIKITLTTYAHYLPSDDETLALSFGSVLSCVNQSHPEPANGSLNGSRLVSTASEGTEAA